MDWKAFLALLKRHPKKTIAGVILIASTAFSAGGYMLYAEQCHAQAQTNRQVIGELLEYQRGEILREKIKAEEAAKSREKIAELCRAKKIKDRDECAKAGVTLP